MRKTILLLCLAAGMSASASERTLAEMQTLARRCLNTQAAVKSATGNKMVQTVTCVSQNDAYAVFEPESREAYVIISKSDLTTPVIGYARGAFRPGQMPAALQWYLSTVENSIVTAEQQGLPMGQDKPDVQPVEPFITTTWHQSDPFNMYAPKQYPAGCVAIAMAQCINYCRYPDRVNFRGYCGYLANSSSTRYTIDSLDIKSLYFYPYLDSYGRATNAQKKAVGTLVRDCGYSVVMRYAPDGSGTYNYYCGISLVEYFKYPEACVKYMSRTFCSEEQWFDIIYTEMQQRCPIIMGGNDESFGGHAFVLCGLDEDGLVYVNWGWGSDGDGFYDLTLMNPKGYEFKSYNDIVYGLRSTPLASDVRRTRVYSMDGEPYTFDFTTETDSDGKEHPTLNISLTTGMENYSPSSLEGEFGLFGTDLTTGQPFQIKETDPAEWGAGSYIQLDEPDRVFYYYVDNDMVPGHTYRLSFGTRDKEENQWHSLLCYGGEIAYDVTYTGDPATCTISEVMNIVPTAIHAPMLQPERSQSSLKGWFDLNGRSISQPRKGINIVNGRKVIF